jgi:soluble lytic murein transglycosylase-like protein
MNRISLLTALIGLSLAAFAPAWAEAPAFGAKRVRAPAPGTPPRITVQIDPAEQARLLARPDPKPAPEVTEVAAVAAAVTPGAIGHYAWFWDKVSPALDDARRLEDAMQAISGEGKVAAPRLQALQEIARSAGVPILRATIGTSVSPALVLAMISVESSGRADAVSSAGATGLMQLMPDTAKRFGVTDSLVAEDNIAGGVKYLDWLMKHFGGDPIMVLAGYNAGEGSVRTHQGVPPFAETRDYVPKVLAAFQVARGLCKTPPELISDGCVFASMD